MRLKWNLGLVASVLTLVYMSALAQGFKDDPPRYNYDTLPSTTFSCKGRLTGRYYADVETDCQVFHICVQRNARDVHDFKFLCPNGTTFDQEHQVCMDYFQVVCHSDIGTNPLGHIYELMKLSSGHKNAGLDAEKFSFIDPDVAERNTLGDDFQVEEYNTNSLAAQNSFNYQSSKPNHRRKPSEDIFYKQSTKYTTTTTTTTRRPSTTSSTTAAPLVFRSPITTKAPPRRPSLETYESYEIESVAGLTPQNSQNSFNRLAPNSYDAPRYYDDSYEVRDPEPSQASSTTTTTTTPRPVFHNTYRSPLPQSSTAVPPSFQQQATRFNEDFFRKLPSSTETAVSKAAQFYVNSNTNHYSTPEVRQPSTNPFIKSTTEIPFSPRLNYVSSSTARPQILQQQNSDYVENRYQEKNSPYESFKKIYKAVEVTGKPAISIKSDRGLSNRGQATFADASYQSTVRTTIDNQRVQDKFTYEHAKSKPFSAQISQPAIPDQEEGVIRPRSFSGTTNTGNQINRQLSNRDNFGFSTIQPPTTAEPNTFPTSTTYGSSTQENNGVTYFQRLTTSKPEKSSIFYSRATTYANRDYSEKESKFTSEYYEPTSTYRAVTANDADFGQKSNAVSGSTQADGESFFASSTEYSVPTTAPPPTTTLRPLRRGARRRVSRPRQQNPNPKSFDPEFKYSRRLEPSRLREKAIEKQKEDKKNEEIFAAEESIFAGRPNSNLFQDKPQSQVVDTVKTKVKEVKIEQSTKAPAPKLAENFGRRIRVNTRREQYLRQQAQSEAPSSTTASSSDSSVTKAPRRLIKRLKVKTTTVAEPSSSSTTPKTVVSSTTQKISEPSSTPKFSKVSSFPTTLNFNPSTLRPVTRINVKTKIGTKKLFEKDSEFRVPPTIGQTSSNRGTPLSALEKLKKLPSRITTTTPEPELVTASEDDIVRRKLKKLTTIFHGLDDFTTPTTYRPSSFKNTTSSVSFKVTNNKSQSHKSAIPTPISFKEPILSKVDRKETKVEVKQSESVHEESTRSPDYDYAYYNTDDDYTDEKKKVENIAKSYGKKPGKKVHQNASK